MFALGKETAAHTVIGCIVLVFLKLRSRELSARSNALHSVCLNFFPFFHLHWLSTGIDRDDYLSDKCDLFVCEMRPTTDDFYLF